MDLILGGLAVYKLVQVIDSLLPKEPMPWVKLLVSVAFGYCAALLLGTSNIAISGLSIAAVAGATHSLLRLTTLAGDYAQRKSLR
jgi:hypothetical protein